MSRSMQLQKASCRGWTPPTETHIIPVITGLSLYTSDAGTTAIVTISGKNFYSYSSVKFGNESPTVQFINTNYLQFYVPVYLTAGTYPVQVVTGAAISNSVNYVLVPTSGFWQQQPDSSISNTNANATSSATVSGTGIVRLGGLALSAPLLIDDSNANSQTTATIGLANWIICNTSNDYTIPLPSPSQYTGRQMMIKSTMSTVYANQSIFPQTSADTTTLLLVSAGKWATIVSNGTYWVVMQSG